MPSIMNGGREILKIGGLGRPGSEVVMLVIGVDEVDVIGRVVRCRRPCGKLVVHDLANRAV